jgi:hypothetical protein
VICLGVDGCGCGMVIGSDNLEDSSSQKYMNPYYSAQEHFASFLSNGKGKLKNVNLVVEKNLNKFDNEKMVTSDFFKNTQRNNVQETLENLRVILGLSYDLIDEVKFLYSRYRENLSRIHKLNLVLACMFVIASEI